MNHHENPLDEREGGNQNGVEEMPKGIEPDEYVGEYQQAPRDEDGEQVYYDPDGQHEYYYDPVDGNYYYYAAPLEGGANSLENLDELAAVPDGAAKVENFDDWEPEHYNCFSDTILSLFASSGYKLYLCLLLYCAIVLQFMLSLNWTMQILYRFYAPQSELEHNGWSPVCFFVIFILFTFTVVTALCTSLDMLHGVWHAKRDDTHFWGVMAFSGKTPPVLLYVFIIALTTILPFLWGVIEASAQRGSFVYFLRIYAFAAIVTMECMIVACYLWFYILGIRQKVVAARTYEDRDDFQSWVRASKYAKDSELKKRWYHASTLLEEYGLDHSTLRWNSLVFTIGFVPLFSVYTAHVFSANVDYPDMTWGVICSVALCCIYFLSWTTLFRIRSHWSIYLSVFLIAMLLLFGIIGAAASHLPAALGFIVVLFLLTQCMLTRKRLHSLTQIEQCVVFRVRADTHPQGGPRRRRWDMYLCCCRELIVSCFRCLGAREAIGYRHPDIVRAEEQYNRESVCLRTDQKVLLYWWLFVMVAVATLIGMGNSMTNDYKKEIATASGVPIDGSNPGLAFCGVRYNTNGSTPLGLFELSLLSALSYTVGTTGEADFATWFSFFPNFVRKHPMRLPPSLNYVTGRVVVPFSHYVDLTSDYHFVTLNTNYRGLSLMGSLDEWGASVTLQLAKVFSPIVSMWPSTYQRSFVQKASFIRQWFPGIDVLHNVSVLVEGLIDDGKKERVVLVGDGFNGGYAKLLSSKFGVQFVAFNAPGGGNRLLPGVEGTQIVSARALVPLVDTMGDTTHTVFLPCDESYSSVRCGKIETTITTLGSICGDQYGRSVK
uniref:Uncharacterized protein n=1 Tax=Trypanosoma congolense (strain IL3000) TaxID=1068625 RepID=G0UP85_TRYCI|nr:conserved hypothetical protein [Trypanosoma congolense IL3000]